MLSAYLCLPPRSRRDVLRDLIARLQLELDRTRDPADRQRIEEELRRLQEELQRTSE